MPSFTPVPPAPLPPHHCPRTIAKDFLDNLTKAVPYKIHPVLTDNGIQFTKREGTEAYWVIPFDRLCDALGIEHRLTKINHPWTNGQVERMNRTIRTIKEATVRRNYYQSHDHSHDHLKQHLHTFLMAYTFAKRRKTLKGLTPYEHICKIWTNEPERFTVNPFQHNVGLNIQR
jgi:transposase InsO family protein